MALALAGHYQTTWAPEYGRLYTEGRLHTSSSWCTDDFVHIARVQNLLEDSLAESCNRILICDTDSFATSVWHERYMGDASAEVDALCVGRQYDLYLLTDADIPFVQDGLRDGEHIRDWMHGRFEERLKAWNKPYLVLSGSHEQRLRQAVAACDAILA
jgi:NadR type nicotinamide-nucleotide adenylyltransferase